MGPLTERFCQESPGAAADDDDADALEQALRSLAGQGRDAWPALPVPPESLAAHAARALGKLLPGEAAPAIAGLRAKEVHLACACALAVAGAAEALDRDFLRTPALDGALARIDPAPSFRDEVRQALREKLLIGKPGERPRIAHFSGRGSLSNWVCAVALRLALDLRKGRPAPRPLEEAFAIAASQTSPEMRAVKGGTSEAFKRALESAVATLDDEACTLLKLSYVEGLKTSQIASLYRLDRSTIKRRLAAAREQLMVEAQKHLRQRLKLPPAELESLAGLLQGELQLSLERILRRG